MSRRNDERKQGDKLSKFDSVKHLPSFEHQAELFNDAIASGNARQIAIAFAAFVDERGMSKVALDAGVTYEALHKALSDNGDMLTTLVNVLNASDLRLTVLPVGRHLDRLTLAPHRPRPSRSGGLNLRVMTDYSERKITGIKIIDINTNVGADGQTVQARVRVQISALNGVDDGPEVQVIAPIRREEDLPLVDIEQMLLGAALGVLDRIASEPLQALEAQLAKSRELSRLRRPPSITDGKS